MSDPATSAPLHQAIRHDSAEKHVSGTAQYIDDLPLHEGTLHVYLGLSDVAVGVVRELDLSEVVDADGVRAILTASDIPGVNDFSPTGLSDEPIFATDRVEYHGHPLFAVVADTRDQARRAAAKVRLSVDAEEPVIDVAEAQARKAPYVTKPLTLQRGDVAEGQRGAVNRVQGSMRIGGQDHFYLEGQIAYAVPGEDDDMLIYSSTQHPSEVQHLVAHALHVPANAVTIEIRRMGGGFGGKETQPALFAAVAALAARKTGKPVKLRPDRDDDMIITGKRHDFKADYDVAFDEHGVIQAVDADLAARCGHSSDLSGPVTDRALFHADNAYFYPHVRLSSHPYRTNTVSNTAFRGFGGPQGLLMAERVIEEIAYHLNRDPLEIRRANFYGPADRDLTPYHQRVSDFILPRLVDELAASSDYTARRAAIIDENSRQPTQRRGIALTPVKFGISFTATWYNQAGALLHVYRDGSVHLNHGGTEMGQGLFVKVAQVVADCFAIDLEQIKITPTTTAKVPNTSATAASSGSDLNGMAAYNAAETIKLRLIEFAAEHWQVRQDEVRFTAGHVIIGSHAVPFADLIDQAYLARVQLSAAGFYKTPTIHWDRDSGKGRPFYYFAYGAAVSEVTVDTLTGEYQVTRTDILHDVGRSLNPAIDRGQVEGGFIQGMGWVTTEELWWDQQGRLRTHAPSTYKIPLASDVPREFNVNLADWSENSEPTIGRSKAVGEPPFMLAASVLEALSMAVASLADYRVCPRLDVPATPEQVFWAAQRMREAAKR